MADQRLVTSDKSSENNELSGDMINHLCQPCSETQKVEADVFCQSCNEYQCSECAKVHKRFTFMKNHKIVKVKLACDKADFIDMNGLDRCKRHGKHIEYFCKDDSELCCSSCAIKNHRTCNNVEDITHIVEGDKKQISIQMKMVELKEKCKSIARQIAVSEEKLGDQVGNLPVHIDEIRASTRKVMTDFEENINLQLKTINEQFRNDHSNKRAKLDEIVRNIEKNVDMLDSLSENVTSKQSFIVQHRVEQSLNDTKIQVRNEQYRLEDVFISFKVCDELEDSDNLTDKILSLKIGEKTICPILDGIPVKLEKIIGIDLHCPNGDSVKPIFSGMDFLPDGRLVVTDWVHLQCLVFSEQLEKLNAVDFSDDPIGIATTAKNEVAISYGNAVGFFQVIENNELDLIRTITTTQHHSICVKDNENFVLGICHDYCPDDSADGYEDESNEGNDNNDKEHKFDIENEAVFDIFTAYEDANDHGHDADISSRKMNNNEKNDIEFKDKGENTEKSILKDDDKISDKNEDEGNPENRLKGEESYETDSIENVDYESSKTDSEEYYFNSESEDQENKENENTEDRPIGVEETDYSSEGEEEFNQSYDFLVKNVFRIAPVSGDENVASSSKNCHLGSTLCAYIKYSDKVVISDSGEDSVSIYDERTRSRISVVDECIKEPYGVVVGPFNIIFVCCGGTNRVVQISETGRIMSKSEIDMEHPWSICISADKTKLAISNIGKVDRKLQLYSISL